MTLPSGSGSPATTPAASTGGGPGSDDAGTLRGPRPHASQDTGAPENEGDIPPASDTPGDKAGDTGSAGDDAGPAELPFSGLELAVLAMMGLATAASGTLIRRAA